MDLLQIFYWISPSMILATVYGKRHYIVEKSKNHKKLHLIASLLTLPEACYAIYSLVTNEQIMKRWDERKKQTKITDYFSCPCNLTVPKLASVII